MKLYIQRMRFCAVLFVGFLTGCSNEHTAAPPVVGDYFPLEVGTWFIYKVDSTVISQDVSVTYHYDLRVEATESFFDSGGEKTWMLQRSKRADSTAAWSSIVTWSARVTDFSAIVNEGNVPYVKISGAPVKGEAWDGNQYNNLGGTERCPGSTASTCDIYTITDYGSYPAGTGSFDQSITVTQNNDSDVFISSDIRSEVYARNVGLVFRAIYQVEYCQTEDCYGQQQIAKGIDFKQTLTQHGSL